jgi:hypothetical protein
MRGYAGPFYSRPRTPRNPVLLPSGSPKHVSRRAVGSTQRADAPVWTGSLRRSNSYKSRTRRLSFANNQAESKGLRLPADARALIERTQPYQMDQPACNMVTGYPQTPGAGQSVFFVTFWRDRILGSDTLLARDNRLLFTVDRSRETVVVLQISLRSGKTYR